MSKVQSPKFKTEAASDYRAQVARVGAGRWTVDGGPQQEDIGQSTLDVGLAVNNLRKSFLSPHGDRIEVLRGASFSASRGEAVAVVGSSGAGKSTLLHLLGGLEASDDGNITAAKFAIDRAGPTALARFRNRHVGFVFQFHHLLPDLTAAENVSLPLRITRTRSVEAMRRAMEMLQEVGLDSRVSNSRVGRLSGGEQQRVAVCRALITRPALVLADEPTGNLDTTNGNELARTLVSYARNNRAVVIMATHNPSLAEICDRTLLLNNGILCTT
jgi:lipoprotein-releasing system ATP-binding protein